jgi:allantoinase
MIAKFHRPWLEGKPSIWALKSRAVVTPEGSREAAVVIGGAGILGVASLKRLPGDCPVFDVGDRAVLPGLIDTHVHINEPGRTDWEGFETATRAAAAGGITTVIDMPLNSSPVTTTLEALRQKEAAAQGKMWVDCGFHGGVVPGNADQFEALAEEGVLGFKAFLCPSGIEEFPPVTEADLRTAMPILKALQLPLLVHAELVTPLPDAVRDRLAANPRSYAAYLASRPPEWEHQAIQLLIALCREYRCHVHIVHLSSAGALPMLAQAKDAGLPLTVETCPHYLCFAAEEIPDGDPRFKCAPPIRDRENRDRLWEALGNGLIDTIASDHSPAPPALKELATGNLQTAWGGIASLQLALPAVWTEARRRGFTLADVARWMAYRPAEIVDLDFCMGHFDTLSKADLVVFDPEAPWVVEPARLYHRHPVTPYEGRTLVGRIDYTFVGGQPVFAAGKLTGPPRGQTFWSKDAPREEP